MNTYHRASRRFPNVIVILIAFLLASCGKAQTQKPVESKWTPERAKLAEGMEDIGGQHIHMPPIPLAYSSDRYINVNPAALSKDALKGKVVLIDIWDYTCVNCIQTLPYIKEWNARYKDKGLVIIGVHSPEFEFEKETQNLDSAVKGFGLTYPVIADNDYEIWNGLANQYWPAKYLFDKNGILRAEHFGEGEYQSFEAFLQKILLERDSTIELPEPVAPVRETDKPGAVCYRPTPETYVGFARSHIGNEDEEAINKPKRYVLPKDLEKDKLYLEGDWTVRRQYAQPTSVNDGASLVIDYQAKEANLVIRPLAESGFRVFVTEDGKPVAKADRGTDLKEEDGKTYLDVRDARMYYVMNNAGFSRHTLRLTAMTPSFGAYAFTFTTACKGE